MARRYTHAMHKKNEKKQIKGKKTSIRLYNK